MRWTSEGLDTSPSAGKMFKFKRLLCYKHTNCGTFEIRKNTNVSGRGTRTRKDAGSVLVHSQAACMFACCADAWRKYTLNLSNLLWSDYKTLTKTHNLWSFLLLISRGCPPVPAALCWLPLSKDFQILLLALTAGQSLSYICDLLSPNEPDYCLKPFPL